MNPLKKQKETEENILGKSDYIKNLRVYKDDDIVIENYIKSRRITVEEFCDENIRLKCIL